MRNQMHQSDSLHGGSSISALTLGALGVVYGDIGTSPLYALRECFHGPHAIALSHSSVFGILSLIVWSLIFVISIKYCLVILRADNNKEGGILALMALALPRRDFVKSRRIDAVLILGIFGAALLYGDGIITPAISVLSAVEGLKFATPMFEPYILPITAVIIITLFMMQRHGTARIGKAFGPIILVWFSVLGILGVKGIMHMPAVLGAFNPLYAFEFFVEQPWHAFVTLGSVFLVVTGGEALYSDLGHFGRKPIQLGWFYVALPGLLLQYFGQGALLLENPAAIENPFYLMSPSWALYPLVGLSTLATIIASQAVITGAFSLSQQAARLGYLPRIRVTHTSEQTIGQVYVPFINWALLFGTLFLVFEFGSSSNLAAAYGIAVTGTMVITTILTYIVMVKRWGWSRWIAAPIVVFFLVIDSAFFGANLLKIADGGWFPLALGLVIFTLMTTWKKGRKILANRLMSVSVPLEQFLERSLPNVQARIPGVAVFMSAAHKGTPSALVDNFRHNRVLHQRVVILTILTEEKPYVIGADRIQIENITDGFYRIIARYGFMESPNVPALLQQAGDKGLMIDIAEVTFFLGRETVIATKNPGMALWRERLFSFMSRNAQRATDYFKIPANRAIEIGTVVEL
jgi:KUP system potassium uptake protein